MDMFVNRALLSNPMNWLTIAVMLMLVTVSAVVIWSRLNPPATIGTDNGASVNTANEN